MTIKKSSRAKVPLRALSVQRLPIGSVLIRSTNSRVHSSQQIRKIADSMRSVGFVVPILIDERNFILAGHGRLAAAKLLGLETVPTVCVSGLSEAQQRAFVIADNKLTDLSTFDAGKLKSEFQFLIDSGEEFAIEASGFDIVEIDRLLNFDTAVSGGEAVELPGCDVVSVSRVGDLWYIGDHRIMCGSALERCCYEQLFGTERAAMIFTDPPYNVPIGGNVSGLGARKHREFAMASGEMSRSEFTYQFLRPVFVLIRDYSMIAAIAYFCMDWRHTRDVENAAEGVFAEHKNTACWVKNNAGMSAFYRSQHEMILVYKISPGTHRNNFGLGGKGRHRTNVWQYPGVNTFRAGRKEDLEAHPTVKPLKLVSDAILDCSAPGDIIFDPFLGSGTTALAAAKTGRRCYAIEIDPIFVDVSLARLTAGTGLTARLATGETFAEVAAARSVQRRENDS